MASIGRALKFAKEGSARVGVLQQRTGFNGHTPAKELVLNVPCRGFDRFISMEFRDSIAAIEEGIHIVTSE